MKKLYPVLVLLICLFQAHNCIFPEDAHGREKAYVDKKYGFSIAYPSELRILPSQKGAQLTIMLAKVSPFLSNNIIISVAGGRSTGRPLEELVDIYFKYDRTVSEKKEVTINGIKFLSVVQTLSKSFWFIKLRFKLYHLITVKGNRIYTITYNATPETFDRYLPLAKSIMHTFKFIK